MSENTLFLRAEAPLQAWGERQTRFVVRRTTEAPTRSGITGLLCAALGLSRAEAELSGWLERLASLGMGVRIDRAGRRWWDYHTVGAGLAVREAGGGSREHTILTRREYLCDASFLVVMQGDPLLIGQLAAAVERPHWTLYLGRKSCPPSRPIAERPAVGSFPDLPSALKGFPWRKQYDSDRPPDHLECLVEWRSNGSDCAPADAEVWYDVPVRFEPPVYRPRFVVRQTITLAEESFSVASKPLQRLPSPSERPRANYANTEYRKAREARLAADQHLCIFCKAPANTVQHITYERAGGSESQEDLRSLCRLCHDAVTMLEYGENMGMERINPEEPRWRTRILQKRDEIVRYRSLETRRRRLAAQEVE